MPVSDRARAPAVRRVGEGSAGSPAGRAADRARAPAVRRVGEGSAGSAAARAAALGRAATGVSPLVLGEQGALPRKLEQAVARGARWLAGRQDPAGFWCGELEADTTLESDTVKMWRLLGRVDPERERRLARTILRQQLPDGGWPIYAHGVPELNASVKAYVALRLAGLPAEHAALQRARPVILRLGGLERINSFEKVYLALLGLYPWEQVPALPPEVILLPRWFPFNIYEIAYWSRTILIPLAVLYATRPAWARAPFAVEELWVDPERKRARITILQKTGAGWRAFFLGMDRLLKLHERARWKPLRRIALRRADRWMTERILETDGLGAIYPAMLNAVFGLKALGYSDGDPVFERSIREVERLELPDDDGGLKLQPCFSPVWDTSLALYALGRTRRREQVPGTEPACTVPGTAPAADAGDESDLVPGLSVALEKAARWLEEREVRVWGDWRMKNPGGRPGGWAFEFRNPFYPDVDDTAQVLLGFLALRGRAAAPSTGAFQRGLSWILSMQNRDGGWSSYDKNNDCRPLNHFPFADHNAMLDPSCPDITGRVLELLSEAMLGRSHPAVGRAVAYLREHQEADGSWFGRWSVNYIYGTWLALRGLKAAGEPMESLRCQQAGRWVISHQGPDGGWGESCRSYDDPSLRGQGPSTASQTAWALMALLSLDRVAEPEFHRGLEYLLRTQREDGSWEEEHFTGTGFPRVFYLKYHLYPAYFPVLALAEAQELFRYGARINPGTVT